MASPRKPSTPNEPGTRAIPGSSGIAPAEPPTMEDAKALYYDLAERANSGDPEAQRQFRSLTRFADHKTSVASAVLQDGIIRHLAPDIDFTSQLAVADEMNKMARDLAGTNPNGLERILAEQVVFTFMLMRIAESQAMSAKEHDEAFFEDQVALCENRYYSAAAT